MTQKNPLPNGKILHNRYEINGLLGEGGMGRVYKARDIRLCAEIALKETFGSDKLSVKAFEREAKNLANLHHEAFPRVMDYFSEEGSYFFVMELIEGNNLHDLLNNNKPFELEEVLGWADQILDALEYLNDKDFVHQDIKPQNLKVNSRNKVKLLDFGIAKGAIEDITTIKKSEAFDAGTREFAPIEQLLKFSSNDLNHLQINHPECTEADLHKQIDCRTDLYALGATIYKLLSNQTPTISSHRAASIWSKQIDTLQPIIKYCPHISSEVAAFISKAMELEQEDRFQSASEMRKELNRVRRGIAKEQNSLIADNKLISHEYSLYDYVKDKYRFENEKNDNFSQTTEYQRLTNRLGEIVRKAELLGFHSLLNDLKNEVFILNNESINRLERMIVAESENLNNIKNSVNTKQPADYKKLNLKLSEVIRRAEVLGFYDLLNDFKDQNFTLNDESIEKLEKMIDVESKILDDIQKKETFQKEQKNREERYQRAEEIKKENRKKILDEKLFLREEQRSQIDAQDKSRRKTLLIITGCVSLTLIVVIGMVGFVQNSMKLPDKQLNNPISNSTNKSENIKFDNKNTSQK